MEIGSIFELDRNKLGVEKVLHLRLLETFKSQGYGCFLQTASGREALMAALLQILQQNKSAKPLRCLLPMYTCDTVIQPFTAHKAQISYFPVTEQLCPEPEALCGLIHDFSPQVIAVHPYYGTDTLQQIRPLLKDFQQKGGIVIEDLTQCLFLTPSGGLTADYYVVSLRKWLDIPDGGLLIAKRPPVVVPTQERTAFVAQKVIALTDKFTYLNGGGAAPAQAFKQQFLDRNRAAEKMLEEDFAVCRMSGNAVYISNHTDFDRIFKKRAQNAAVLGKLLKDAPAVTCPIAYTGSAAPLYFPVYAKDRAGLQRHLREHNIYAPVLWKKPGQIESFDRTTGRIYEQLLALPCDQRYDPGDMAYLADTVKTFS